MAEENEQQESLGPEGMPDVDLTQIRVEAIIFQVASELMSIGAGQLGMIPGMINGGDALQARLAIGAADALIGSFLGVLPEGAEPPPQVQELRSAVAELKLAYAEAVGQAPGQPVTGQASSTTVPPAPPARPEPPRPKIWTPGGDV